jgi:hypothetical protein
MLLEKGAVEYGALSCQPAAATSRQRIREGEGEQREGRCRGRGRTKRVCGAPVRLGQGQELAVRRATSERINVAVRPGAKKNVTPRYVVETSSVTILQSFAAVRLPTNRVSLHEIFAFLRCFGFVSGSYSPEGVVLANRLWEACWLTINSAKRESFIPVGRTVTGVTNHRCVCAYPELFASGGH